MKNNSFTTLKCAKCKFRSTTPNSKICGHCAAVLVQERKCTICNEGPTMYFTNGFTTDFCPVHVFEALEDSQERKGRLGMRIKEMHSDLSDAQFRLREAEKRIDELLEDRRHYKNLYLDLREKQEQSRLEGARKRMKTSDINLSKSEMEEIEKFVYSDF